MRIIMFSCQIKIIKKFSINDDIFSLCLIVILALQIMLIYRFLFQESYNETNEKSSSMYFI